MRAAALGVLLLAACGGGPLEEGAGAFAEGNLDAAIAPWQEVAARGHGSGALHYNLANAWYRKGDLPRAIAHYRAAQRLRPRDGNVHHNLAVARADLDAAEAPIPEPAPPPTFWMRFVTAGELGVLGLLLTSTGSALAVLWRRRSRAIGGARVSAGLGLPAAVAWGFGVALVATSIAGAWADRLHPAGVVSHLSSVRDLPRPDAEERFSLPAGAELVVVRELGDFVLVEDGRGRRGWIARAALLIAGRPDPLDG